MPFHPCSKLVLLIIGLQRVVVLKDEQNKKAHEHSAQLACEAAGAIRTVASLTRENDCCRLYSESLDGPLRNSNRKAIYSNFIYALSQALTFFVIALIFWYGSRLVASQEYTTFQFFVGLMVCHVATPMSFVFVSYSFRALLSAPFKPETCSHSCLTFPRLRLLPLISSPCWTRCRRLMPSLRKETFRRTSRVGSGLRMCTSVIPLVQECVSCVT